MKIKKEVLRQQRRILEKKLQPWRAVAFEKRPPIGWIKAIRGALGMTTKQLAGRLGVNQAGVVRHESRETQGKITLETLNEIAQAMECRVVYAIVPDERFRSLDEILDKRAEEAAKNVMKKVSHSMRLEAQEVGSVDRQNQLQRLARELKEALDPKLWNKT